MELKAVCCDLVNTHFSVVMENDDFFNLDAKQVKDWVSSDDVIVNAEEEIFKGILNWVSYNKSEREQYFPELLHQVRPTSMSRDFLLKELVNEELIATNNECLKFVLGSMEYILDATGESCAKLPRKCLEKYADAIFVCGGMKALCYLPEQNKWYQLSDTLFEHGNHAVVQYREKIFIFDCQEVGPQEKYVLEYFIPGANLWGAIECKNFSDCGSFSSLSVVNGDVYAVTKIPEDEMSTVLRCWPDKDYYKSTEDPPTIRWGASGVSDGSHLYFVGGTSSDKSVRHGSEIVERLDPSKNSWEEVAPMNEARHDAFGAALNGKIYVAGGLQLQENRRSCKVLESCEVYNPITNEWELISSLNVTRCCADMVAFRGVLYVLGGYKDAILYKTELTVEMLNPETSEWESTSVIPCESGEETNNYRACFATVHKNVLQNKL